MPPLEAALQGAQEIGFTVLSISISLVAVFIPMLLMGGIVGRLFREFAVTLSVAIARFAGRFADHHADDVRAPAQARHGQARHGRLSSPSERVFNGILGLYERQPALGAAPSACSRWSSRSATIGLNVYLYVIVPKGFFPQQDTGRLIGVDPGRSGHFLPGDATKLLSSSSTSSATDPGRRHRDRHSPAAAAARPTPAACSSR